MTLETRRRITDLNVMVAGQGGDGSLTIATLLGRLLGGHGYHMYTARNVASRIKGGHAAALLRGAATPCRCMGDHLDLLVAFDAEAIEMGGPWLSPDGIVVFDSSAGPPPDGILPETARVYSIPFDRLAVRDLRRDLFKNSLGFGVVARILSVDDAAAADLLATRFAHLRPEVAAANLRALHAGFSFADEHQLRAGLGPWALDRIEHRDRLLIAGNEAIALGFLVAGGRFFAGYPITPASEILTWLERRLPEFGGVAVQAEDELSAINMALGAALT